MTTSSKSSQQTGARLVKGLCGAVLGYAAIAPFMNLAGPVLVAGGTGAVALAGIAVVYVLIGALVVLGTLAPRFGARVLNVADQDDLAEQSALLRSSGASAIMLGGAMLALAFAGPVGVVPDWLGLGAIGAALLASLVVTLAQRSQRDELLKQLSHESGSLAFAMSALVLGGWAALAYLDLAVPLDPLWLVAALATIMLLAGFLAAGRRGLLAPPQG